MTIEEYKREVNPCYSCGCWDEDMGCTMSSQDVPYACSLEDENSNNLNSIKEK